MVDRSQNSLFGKIKNKKFGCNINYQFQNRSSVKSEHEQFSQLEFILLFINSPKETITQPLWAFNEQSNGLSLWTILMDYPCGRQGSISK